MSPDSPSQPDQLDEVVAAYLRAIESGEKPSRDEMLARHPGLADELREFFADHDRMNRLAEPLCEQTLVYPAIAAAECIRYFGDYEVLDEIARGGMGVVFKARQVTLNRIVAIKMILSGQLASPADVERFHTEAEAAAKLDHPGIVPIYEVGQHEGQHYFSMGFVDGQSLSARITNGPLPAREAAGLARTVAEAVQYAHEHGVVHRDLKPGNILLDRQGNPRITDFGLAKLTESHSDLTGTGQILGTPGYMPPEQAAAQASAVGHLSDIYSLGAILYCLLTGRPPFQAATPIETLLQVQKQEPVPPRQLNPNIPLDLDTIVLKCLDKSPTRRYASAKLLAEELNRYLAGRPILARRVTRAERFRRWCQREPVVAGLSAAVLLALIAGISVSAYFAVKESTRATSEAQARQDEKIQRKEAQKQTGIAKQQTGIAIAALEEERLAKERAVEAGRMEEQQRRLLEQERIKLQRQLRIATAERLAALSNTKRSDSPEVSLLLAVESGRATRFDEERLLPDSHQALLVALTSIGGRPLIGHQGTINSVAISPDSRWIVTGSDDNTARVWDRQAEYPSANPRVLTGHQMKITCVAISPDSRWLVTGSWDNTARVWDLTAENPAANPRVLSGHQGAIRSLAISPNGRWLATGSDDATARVWNLAAADPAANPRVLRGHQHWVWCVAISADSRWLATGSWDNTARVWDLTAENPAENPRILKGHQQLIFSVAISPDGRWLVTGSWDNTARAWDLTGQNQAANPCVLSGHQGWISSVAISPDSRWIVTGSYDNTARVWDISAENPAADPRVLSGEQQVNCVAISPDNRWIVTADRYPGKTARVWDLTAEGPAASPRVLSGHQEWITSVAISLDSRWLVTGSDDKTARVWDLTAENPAANPRVLSGQQQQVDSVTISPDSRWIVTGSDSKTARVWDLTAENPAANPRVLSGHQERIANLAISPDSRWIVTGSGDNTARVWDLAAADPAANPHVLHSKLHGAKAHLRALAHMTGLFGHQVGNISVAISPDSRWIVMGSGRDDTAQAWDLTAQNPAANPRVLSGHQKSIYSMAISPDGRRLVTGSWDNTARVWDLAAADPASNPRILNGHQSVIYCMAISLDSRWLVTGSQDDTARVWDLTAEDPTANPRVLSGLQFLSGQRVPSGRQFPGIHSVAISPDNRWIATRSQDKTVLVWNLTAENPSANPRVLRGHRALIYSVAISADSRWIVTGSEDKTARVWDLSAENPSANPRVLSAHEGEIRSVAISPDCRWIVTGSSDKTTRIWLWQWDDLVALAGQVGRNFDRDEWKLYFPDEPYRKTFPDLPVPGDP